MKIKLLALLLVFLISCNSGESKKDETPTDGDVVSHAGITPVTPTSPTEPVNPTIPTDPDEPKPTAPIAPNDVNTEPEQSPKDPVVMTPVEANSVPVEAMRWDAEILFANFNSSDEDKVLAAISLMKKVIASKAFKDGILSHTYNDQKTFVDNGGYTNSQIYQKILDGAEKLQPTKNNIMDIELELYYASTNTVGYTYTNSKRIWMNTKYFNTYTPANVTGNLMHEWLHKLGFGHSSAYTTYRKYSVPYAVGYLMERLAKTH